LRCCVPHPYDGAFFDMDAACVRPIALADSYSPGPGAVTPRRGVEPPLPTAPAPGPVPKPYFGPFPMLAPGA